MSRSDSPKYLLTEFPAFPVPKASASSALYAFPPKKSVKAVRASDPSHKKKTKSPFPGIF